MAQSDAQRSWVGLIAGVALLASAADSRRDRVDNRPDPVETRLERVDALRITSIDPPERGFYSRVLICDGILIKSHADVSDAALREAANRVRRLLKDIPVVRQNLVAQGAEVHIIGKDQATSDLPEWNHMKGKFHWGSDSILFDDRTRGMGGLISSCGEENLLRLPSDRYKGRDICSHEFSHGILGSGVSPNIVQMVEEQYNRSKQKGLWPSYAGTNPHEYFAELTMWYIGSRGDLGSIKPTPESGPEWLRRYDPEGYALIHAFYTGKLPVRPIPLKTLKAEREPIASTAPEGGARRRTTIVLDNRSRSAVKVFTVDSEGERKPLMDVPPGDKYTEDAQAGQVWLVTTEDGDVVGYYRCTRERGLIVIGPGGAVPPGQTRTDPRRAPVAAGR